MRRTILAEGEHYHVFNRGVEKRNIFLDTPDLERFKESLKEFNSEIPIGSLFEHRFKKEGEFKLGSRTPKLVQIVCYCLNPNHFHLLLKQNHPQGIAKFMQKLGTGYTNYFNEKYKRSGVLFQGKYKAVHIESNEQLLHTSVYINLNNQLGSRAPKLSASSWADFEKGGLEPSALYQPSIILEQFKNPASYRKFARSSLKQILLTKTKQIFAWESDSQADK